MKVLLTSPDYRPYMTVDKHAYVVTTLVVKMPDKKNKQARIVLATPDPPSDDEKLPSLIFFGDLVPSGTAAAVTVSFFLELMPWHFASCWSLVSASTFWTAAHYCERPSYLLTIVHYLSHIVYRITTVFTTVFTNASLVKVLSLCSNNA
jgi:hypothetical protein